MAGTGVSLQASSPRLIPLIAPIVSFAFCCSPYIRLVSTYFASTKDTRSHALIFLKYVLYGHALFYQRILTSSSTNIGVEFLLTTRGRSSEYRYHINGALPTAHETRLNLTENAVASQEERADDLRHE